MNENGLFLLEKVNCNHVALSTRRKHNTEGLAVLTNIADPKSRDTPCLSLYPINQSEKLVICDTQYKLTIHRDIVSLLPVVYSSINVDYNSGGLQQSINRHSWMSDGRDLPLDSSTPKDLAGKPFMFNSRARLQKAHSPFQLSNCGFDASKKIILCVKTLSDPVNR
jgi:hypothetical protein